MRVIKYFFEEPTHLDSQSPEGGSSAAKVAKRHKSHYRGYLAASDLEADFVGGSALEDQAAARILARVLPGPIWLFNRVAEQEDVALSLLTGTEEIVWALSTMGGRSAMVMGVDPTENIMQGLTGGDEGAPSMRAIADLLDAGCTLIIPEQAQMGHDWNVFSPRPIAVEFRDAMTALPDDTRAFVIPYADARGEDDFYFEQDDIDRFSQHEVR